MQVEKHSRFRRRTEFLAFTQGREIHCTKQSVGRPLLLKSHMFGGVGANHVIFHVLRNDRDVVR